MLVSFAETYFLLGSAWEGWAEPVHQKDGMNTRSLSIAQLIFLNQITVWKDNWVSSDVFPLRLVKCQIFLSAGHHNNIKKKPPPPPPLQCEHPGLISEAAKESLPRNRQNAARWRVESWSRHQLHRHPETSTIWRFMRSLVLCWGEEECARFSLQSHILCRE